MADWLVFSVTNQATVGRVPLLRTAMLTQYPVAQLEVTGKVTDRGSGGGGHAFWHRPPQSTPVSVPSWTPLLQVEGGGSLGVTGKLPGRLVLFNVTSVSNAIVEAAMQPLIRVRENTFTRASGAVT